MVGEATGLVAFYGDFFVARYKGDYPTLYNTVAQQPTIKCYPNPFSHSTQITSNYIFNNVTLNLYTIFGQRIKQQPSISGYIITLQRDNLPSGLYIAEIKQENKIMNAFHVMVSDN